MIELKYNLIASIALAAVCGCGLSAETDHSEVSTSHEHANTDRSRLAPAVTLTRERATEFVDALEQLWPQIEAWAMPRLPRTNPHEGTPAAPVLTPEWLLQNWHALGDGISGIDSHMEANDFSRAEWDRTGRSVLRTYIAIGREQQAAKADQRMNAAQSELMENPHIPEDQRNRLLEMMRDTQREMRDLKSERSSEKNAIEALVPQLDRLFPQKGQEPADEPIKTP